MMPRHLLDDPWLAERIRREANATKHDWPYYSSRPLPVVVGGDRGWSWIDTLLMRTGCL